MLLTMHDGRTRLARDVEREVREHFPAPRLRHGHPAQRAHRRGAELRAARHPPRSALRRRRTRTSSSPRRSPRVAEAGRAWAGAVARSWRSADEAGADERDDELREIPVELDRPNPRPAARRFDEEALQALADSLGERGVLQPVLVRPVAGGTYELVAGERRWRAAQLAGLEHDPGARARPRRRPGARGRARREHGPRGPQPGRGGARRARRSSRSSGSRARTSGGASAAAASRSPTCCACSTSPTRCSSCSRTGG